jgi:DNA replication protein DnaC
MKEISKLIPDSLKQDTSTHQTTKTIPSRYNDKTVEEIKKMNSERGRAEADFEKCVQFLNQKGKEQFGNHFTVNPADYEIIFKLLVFAIKDTANASKFNINLSKGILLSGPVGCGKTTLMTLLNHFQAQPVRHVMKSCREVSFEFIQDGYETIHKYSKNSFNRKGDDASPRIYCFDDLGTENNLKYYGNECNVMAEILLSRYDLFVQKKMLTHITTNLSASEIENMYGLRVRSRMREMFNLISFEKDVKDKRI